MSDFLDNIGKIAKNTAKTAIKASGDAVELTKTTLNIKFDEVKRESFYKEIGKIIYDRYRENPSMVDGTLLDFCKCVDELNRSISEQRAKTAEIKNKKFCIACGKKLDMEMLFCPACGNVQPVVSKYEWDDEDEDCDCCDDDCDCCDDDDCDCDKSEEN